MVTTVYYGITLSMRECGMSIHRLVHASRLQPPHSPERFVQLYTVVQTLKKEHTSVAVTGVITADHWLQLTSLIES